jgi:hypothetical protein
MLELFALTVCVIALFSIIFARGDYAYRIVAFKPREQQEEFYQKNWKISLISISLGFLLVMSVKDYSALNFFDLVLFSSCVPIALLLIKSYKLQEWPFNVSLSEDKIVNFIYMTIPVHCFYIVILWQLIELAV